MNFTKDEVLEYAKLSSFSYNTQEKMDEQFKSKDKILENCIKCPRLFSGNTGGQVYLYSYKTNLIFGFRGTEEMKDLITNINILKSPMPLDTLRAKEYPKVHGGFLNQFETLKLHIDKEIDDYLNKNKKDRKIIFIGHSLGGALATLSYCYFCYKYGRICNMGSVTFGSPRVGDNRFFKLYKKKCHNSLRIVNQFDPIPCVPTRRKYKHINKQKWVFDNKINKKNPNRFKMVIKNSLLSVCGWGYSSFEDHSCEKYIEEIEASDMKLTNV